MSPKDEEGRPANRICQKEYFGKIANSIFGKVSNSILVKIMI